MKTVRLFAAGLALAFAVGLAIPNLLQAPATATHAPANKVAVSAGTIEILTDDLVEAGETSKEAVLLAGTMKTSGPTDLVFGVTLECALWTKTTTIGNARSESVATVKVWVEVDGVPVAVGSGDDGTDAGKVTFCNRAQELTTLDFDDEDAQIQLYLKTRTANAFNWISLNVGSGEHEIVVKGALEASLDGTGEAKAGIGKRTLVVEPVKLANDAEL